MNPLVEVYSTMSNKELAEYFGVSETTIRTKAKKLGLKPKDVLKAFVREKGGHDWCEALVDIGRKCPKAYVCDSANNHIYLLETNSHPNADLQSAYNDSSFITGFLKHTNFDRYVLEQLDDLPDIVPFASNVNANELRRSKLFPYLDRIASLRDEGKSYRDIAGILPVSVSYATVSRFVKKLALPNRET